MKQPQISRLFTVAFFSIFVANVALGAEMPTNDTTGESGNLKRSVFSFDVPKEPERRRSVVWPLPLTMLLPGFDQWYEGQEREGAILSFSAFGGLWLSSSARLTSAPDGDPLANRDDRVRTALLGSQIYLASGSFSAFHSFRTSIRTLNPDEYDFLKVGPVADESVGQVVAATWEFSHIKQASTWIPLLVAATIAGVEISTRNSLWNHNSYNIRDFGFATTTSHLAGTNEEALFRGTLMPIFYQSWRSEWASNAATAIIFGAAHYSASNPFPIAQAIAGYYLGWLTTSNRWSLREAVFVHTWWDVILLNAQYFTESRDRSRDAVIRLPRLEIQF